MLDEIESRLNGLKQEIIKTLDSWEKNVRMSYREYDGGGFHDEILYASKEEVCEKILKLLREY